MKMSSKMYLWTKKSPLDFEIILIQSPDPDPDSRYGLQIQA